MAGRRLSITAIDWLKIAERMPETDKAKFLAFRAKSDGYLRRMNSYPENPPKIDWAYYKKTVPVPGMVDNFQKKYEGMVIPYPSDTLSSLIDDQEKQLKKEAEEFKMESNKRIEKIKEDIEQIRSLIPYEQMTMEDFKDAHPDLALDPYNNPTFWPHFPEDQPWAHKDDPSHKGEH